VAVKRIRITIYRRLPEAPLEGLRLDQVELCPSQYTLYLSAESKDVSTYSLPILIRKSFKGVFLYGEKIAGNA
jgi:hypothetical protein